MQYQADENGETLNDFSKRLTSVDTEKTKKRKHKYKTDDACSLQVNGEVLHQKPEDFKKEKRRKKKHQRVTQSDNEISCDGRLAPEIQTERETKTVSRQKKKRKHQHEREDELSILCNVVPVVEHEKLCGTEILTKKKKRDKHDKEGHGNWLLEPISTVITEIANASETSSKPTKKKKKHLHERETETVAKDEFNFVVPNQNLSEPVPETSLKRKKKTKHRHEKEDGIDTSQATRDDETVGIISSLDSAMVEPSELASETVLSASNAPSPEVLVNVSSASNSTVHPIENVPSMPIITFLDALTSVPLANDSSLKPSMNLPSTTHVAPTQNAGNKPSEMTLIIAPSLRESPVHLSKTTSDNTSLMHDSVVHFSQEHSLDLNRVDDSAIDLSSRSLEDVSLIHSLDIPQSQEHLANDSSVENPVIDSSRARPSGNFQSAKRQLFTEEIPSELPAVSKKSLPTRKVRCVKSCSIEAPEDVSENPEPSMESMKRRSTRHTSSPVERQEKVDVSDVVHSSTISHSAPQYVCRTKHPDLPKQPMSVYVRFMRDCRKELLEKNPKLRPTQVFVEAGNRYRELRDEDKEKYVKEFLLETKKYNVAIKRFLEKHPEHKNRWAEDKRISFEKCKSGNVVIISGQQLYINKRTQEHLAIQADDSIRRIMAIYRKEWKQSLDDQEKVVYILEAKQLNAANAASVQSPKTKDSEESAHAKQTRASNYREIEEQFLKENLVAPPVNGYQLFIKEKANAELPFGEINRYWKKQLSQEERNSYSTRAKLARETYKKNLAEFEKKEELDAEFQNLPLSKALRNSLKEEHRLLVSVRKKTRFEKPKKYPDVKSGRPPLNGRLLFCKEQMTAVKDLDFKLRFAELNERWKNRLSQEERDEYSARAKAAQEKFMAERSRNGVYEESRELDYVTSHNSSEKTQTKKRRLPQKEGEPKRQNKR